MAEEQSYEAARDELVAVVQKLETGGTSLQESIALWERGEELAQVCQRWLDGARARLDAALHDGDPGKPTTDSSDGDPGEPTTGSSDDEPG